MELNHLSQRMGKTLTEAELDKAMDAMDIDGRARGRNSTFKKRRRRA